MNLKEAKALMNPSAMNNLKTTISVEEKIDMSKKVNGDAIMVALCKAINDGTIKISSLSTPLIKMLNSSTNTISQTKLGEILDQVRKSQPNMICVISIMTGDKTDTLMNWEFTTSDTCRFNDMFEYVVKTFQITPQQTREKLSKLLKPTIANNIGQLIVKYETSEHKDEIVISITTIARLTNMAGYILDVKFKELM